MRVWIDMTNSPHVPFFRPLIRLLEERGHEVRVSARDFAQTLELLETAGIAHEVVGPPHGGAGRAGKIRAMGSRLRALRAWAGPQRFDLALSHASHELPLAARSLGVPRPTPTTTSSRAPSTRSAHARRPASSFPTRSPRSASTASARRPARCGATRGSRRSTTSPGFTPDPAVLDVLGLDPTRVLAVIRTPPEVSLYHRHGNPLFADVLERLGGDPAVQAVVLPRTPAQRDAIREAALPSLVVPEHAIDAQSLIALADLVVSAGGTMNREAVALGTPVWTTFAGTLGRRRREARSQRAGWPS